MSIKDNLSAIHTSLPENVSLVAVSKFHPIEALQEAYDAGQRIFGESREQELETKAKSLPHDIRWHFIGHLQSNKVKYIAPYISLIHSVDNEKLLKEINKQAEKCGRVIDCLLQIHVAQEETKFGFTPDEFKQYLSEGKHTELRNVRIRGVMGMASNTDDTSRIHSDFKTIRELFFYAKSTAFATDDYFDTLSMGMSGDYEIAIGEGSNMVRIGTAIFGQREY